MGFDSIVEVNETGKLNAPIGTVFKGNLAVPHIHQGADDSFGFAVGLRTIDAGKLLPDTVLPASFAESMAVSSFKFRTVIGISTVDLIRTLGNDSVYEKASCAVLRFIGKDLGIQLSGEVIDGHKQIFARFIGGLPFQQGKPLGIEVNKLARVRLVIALGFTLEAFLDGLLDLDQAFKAILQRLEPLVGTVTRVNSWSLARFSTS